MLDLQVKERSIGKSGVLRREEKIPGVIYGGEKNIPIVAKTSDFIKVFKKAGEHSLIHVHLENKKILALIKDFQLHPVTDNFVHFDIFEVTPEKVIRTKIPVVFNGTPKGVIAGGLLEEIQNHVAIEAKAKDLPQSFEVDIKNLQIGESIHIKDIKVPNNTKIIESLDTVLLIVAGSKGGEEEPTEDASAAKK